MTDDFEAAVREAALKYALQNAIQHGQANPGAVVGKVMGERAELRARAKEVPALVARVVAEVNAMDAQARKAAFAAVEGSIVRRKEEAKGPLKPLANAEPGKVVMRFAPNPSGMPHLGHARGMVVNWVYKEMYQGKVILRFDDTDTTVKPPIPEAYGWIREAFEWVCGRPDEAFSASERMDHYHFWARRAIESGGAYVCECAADAFRALKEQGEACPHRANGLAENLEKWERMVSGAYRRGEAVLRVKTDIRHRDPALRDWVAFRIAEEPHPIVGGKHRAWPLLDFQSAIDDHLAGVTHIIRGKDLRDSTLKQAFLYEHLGWKYPETTYWGRVSIHEFGKFSKSLLGEAIKRGEYEGWDDPRLPTLRALRRRGFQAEAIRSFWLSFGISEKDVAASFVTLEAENRKVVEPVANRYFFVADPVEVVVEGAGDLEARAPLHPDHPERGDRVHRFPGDAGARSLLLAREDHDVLAPGSRVRLKDLCNVEVTQLSSAGGPTRARYVGNDLDFLREPGVRILHWSPPDGVKARVKMPDAGWREGIAERELLSEPVNRVVQLERFGFARVDARDGNAITLYYSHK